MSEKSSQTPIITALDDVELEERKRAIAYQIWEEEGKPEGQAGQHWERACIVVMNYETDLLPLEAPQAPEWLKPQAEVVAAKNTVELQRSTVEPTTSIEEIRKRVNQRTAA